MDVKITIIYHLNYNFKIYYNSKDNIRKQRKHSKKKKGTMQNKKH